MRATRVLYVENDPALRGLMTRLLSARPELQIVTSCGSASEALDSPVVGQCDVALLDLALGEGEMNGMDLGIALRRRNANLGIVIHSQHDLAHAVRRLPPEEAIGWSFLPKSGDLRMEDLSAVLRDTARGVSSAPHGLDATPEAGPLALLSDRQRAIMSLTASGLSAVQVGQRLGVSHDTVRQELSRAYKVLVPEGAEGDDRRTLAVLAYLRLTRESEGSLA
mgnify:CR=1 FL=1